MHSLPGWANFSLFERKKNTHWFFEEKLELRKKCDQIYNYCFLEFVTETGFRGWFVKQKSTSLEVARSVAKFIPIVAFNLVTLCYTSQV
jgi:hypothetical protein